MGALLLAALAGMNGCVLLPQGAGRAAGRQQAVAPDASAGSSPADAVESTRSFLVQGRRYAIGQAASLRVCVTPTGVISTVELLRSSGEEGFDQFAMVWARQADVSGWVGKDQKDEVCGSVRVEIGRGSRPRQGRGVDTALG